ncbi:MAG: fatty acid desaturase [Oligoflexales bacterium]
MITPLYNSRASALRVAILAGLLLAGAILAMSNNFLVVALGILMIGAMYAHAVELQHQCLHYSAFKSRRTNKTIGILLGLPTLTSFHAYRRSHLEHHRNLGTSADTPFFTYQFLTNRSFGSFTYDLLGISHLKASLSAIFGNGDARLISIPVGDDSGTISERFDYGLMGFMVVCAGLVSIAFGPAIVLKLWVLPLLLVAQPIHFFVELPEHIGCDSGTTDVFRSTRTIVGSRFSHWFTNFNNFHTEHHLEPALSMDQMPDVYKQIQSQHKHLVPTYWQFYRSLYRSVIAQSFLPNPGDPTRRHA